MNIWTVFFLVISVVVLASPLLSTREFVKGGSDKSPGVNGRPQWEDNELELDLVSGRLSREDFEAMTGRKAGPGTRQVEHAKGDDGYFPED